MKSIRRQLTVTMLTGFGLLLVVSGGAIYFFTRLALLNEFDAGLRAKALTIMSLAEQDERKIHVGSTGAYFQGSANDVAPQYFELWQTNGMRSVRSDSLSDTDLPMRFGTLAQPLYWDLDLPGDRDGRAIGLRFKLKPDDDEPGQTDPPEVMLVVAADRGTLNETLTTLATVLAVAGLLTLGSTVPLVRWSLRRGHAPLGELARQAAAINADSLGNRFPVTSLPEELQPITARLNDLLSRLEASFERERRFSADLAHELRTPLAELRTLAEVELAWPESGEAEKHRDLLNLALQMEAMVTRLLELARCEDGKLPLQFESVPVASLVAEVWQALAARAKDKELAMHFAVPPEASMQTDRALFRSILTNLLANTVEYTPAQGRGEIRWDSRTQELTVSNTVQDLNNADIPHMFERLWRKDKSRTGGEHCGLGLALSRGFATLLGLELTARLSEDRGLVMTLRRME